MTAKLLTASDVAERMQVSVSSVRRWIAVGELPSVKLSPGRKGPRRVTEQGLAQFLGSRS